MSEVLSRFEKLKQKEKLELLRLWDIKYYEQDNPEVTDEEYDACLRSYNAKYKKKYVSALGKTGNGFDKYEHTVPVLSLDKITTEEGLGAAFNRFIANVVVEPKLDGLTVVYYPDGKLVSRGDGHVGEVLPFADKIPGLPAPMDKPVRMEVLIKKETLEKHFAGETKNPRNIAAGILRRKDYTEDVKHLSFYAYNILGEENLNEKEQVDALKAHGFTTPDYFEFRTDGLPLNIFISSMQQWAASQPYHTDGIVIKRNTRAVDVPINYTSHHPDNAVAFKFVSATETTTLRAIEWSAGRNKFTPVAVFDPVQLGGNTITRASLHNLNIIEKLNVKIGSVVEVTLKNEIIPQIIKSDGMGIAIRPIKHCPICGHELVLNNAMEVCCINDDCALSMRDTMSKIVDNNGMDIEGISDETLAKLYDVMVEKGNVFPFELLKLTEDDFKKAGFTKYMAAKLCTQIAKKKEGVKPENFLYACNIPGVGLSTARDIMAHFSDIDDMINRWAAVGMDIEGIGQVTFASVHKYMSTIRKAKEYVVSFAENELRAQSSASKGLIVITGKLSRPKAFYEALITDAGYHYSDSCTKNTDYLVAADPDGNSTKLQKARKNGTKVIGEAELMELLK